MATAPNDAHTPPGAEGASGAVRGRASTGMRSTPKACGGRQAAAQQTPKAYLSEPIFKAPPLSAEALFCARPAYPAFSRRLTASVLCLYTHRQLQNSLGGERWLNSSLSRICPSSRCFLPGRRSSLTSTARRPPIYIFFLAI